MIGFLALNFGRLGGVQDELSAAKRQQTLTATESALTGKHRTRRRTEQHQPADSLAQVDLIPRDAPDMASRSRQRVIADPTAIPPRSAGSCTLLKCQNWLRGAAWYRARNAACGMTLWMPGIVTHKRQTGRSAETCLSKMMNCIAFDGRLLMETRLSRSPFRCWSRWNRN